MKESTSARIFEKLDELYQGQTDIRERITKVETKSESYYHENEVQHNQMASMVAELKDKLESVESTLDQRKGSHKVLGMGWQFVVALVSSGILLSIGGLLAKALGLFG